MPDTGATPTPGSKDFRRLRESGETSGASLAIGARICAARDDVARFAIRIGFTPNRMTFFGFLITGLAGFFLLRGAGDQVPYFHNGTGPTSFWPMWAAVMLFVAGASDMLDGAIARVGKMSSQFGAILDSTLDRFGDMALYLGCMFYFILADELNLTLVVLSAVAMCGSFMISYVKARAEEIIEDCSVGYWLRGERFAAVLIGCACGHVIAVVWQLAIMNLLTVWRRVDYARRVVTNAERGLAAPPAGPQPGIWGLVQLWRHPRGSIQYDVVTGTNIAWIIAAPWIWPAMAGQGAYADPLRIWLGS